MTHQNGHDKRPASQPQPHRRWQAIDVNGVEAEQNAEEDACEDGGKLGFLQHLHRIAQPLRGGVERILIPHKLEHVAKLEP